MTRVFVYGTLKRGGSNHRYLQAQHFLSTATTAPDYRMFGLEGYPGLVEVTPGTGLGIVGEVWSVDETCLAELDRLEGVDEGLYRRGPIRLDPPRSDAVYAYFYLGSVKGRADLGSDFPAGSR